MPEEVSNNVEHNTMMLSHHMLYDWQDV